MGMSQAVFNAEAKFQNRHAGMGAMGMAQPGMGASLPNPTQAVYASASGRAQGFGGAEAVGS